MEEGRVAEEVMDWAAPEEAAMAVERAAMRVAVAEVLQAAVSWVGEQAGAAAAAASAVRVEHWAEQTAEGCLHSSRCNHS